MSDYAELRAAVAKNCHALLIDDPDTIRTLLAERDALREALLALINDDDNPKDTQTSERIWRAGRAALAQGERHETV